MPSVTNIFWRCKSCAKGLYKCFRVSAFFRYTWRQICTKTRQDFSIKIRQNEGIWRFPNAIQKGSIWLWKKNKTLEKGIIFFLFLCTPLLSSNFANFLCCSYVTLEQTLIKTVKQTNKKRAFWHKESNITYHLKEESQKSWTAIQNPKTHH